MTIGKIIYGCQSLPKHQYMKNGIAAIAVQICHFFNTTFCVILPAFIKSKEPSDPRVLVCDVSSSVVALDSGKSAEKLQKRSSPWSRDLWVTGARIIVHFVDRLFNFEKRLTRSGSRWVTSLHDVLILPPRRVFYGIKNASPLMVIHGRSTGARKTINVLLPWEYFNPFLILLQVPLKAQYGR